MKKKLAISFSGGRTSAVMTRLCLEKYRDTHEIAVVFANTGCEHEETLKFIKACDDNWNFGTVWVEAVVGAKGVGIRHKVVTFETASRKGEPFEAVIAKYGIPNAGWTLCTARLKEEVINSLLALELGWRRGKHLNYQTAIGIRADEIDRVSASAGKQGFIYPLASAGWTKQGVKDYMAKFPWDLKLAGEHYGNCTWCWKKSLRKHLTLAKHSPEVFDFPARMEAQYGHLKALPGERRVFFRGKRSALDILHLARTTNFEEYTDYIERQGELFDMNLDVGSACGESCEIGADEN